MSRYPNESFRYKDDREYKDAHGRCLKCGRYHSWTERYKPDTQNLSFENEGFDDTNDHFDQLAMGIIEINPLAHSAESLPGPMLPKSISVLKALPSQNKSQRDQSRRSELDPIVMFAAKREILEQGLPTQNKPKREPFQGHPEIAASGKRTRYSGEEPPNFGEDPPKSGKKPPNSEEKTKSGKKPPNSEEKTKSEKKPPYSEEEPPNSKKEPPKLDRKTKRVEKATNIVASVDATLDVADALLDEERKVTKIVGATVNLVGSILDSKDFKHGGKAAAAGMVIDLSRKLWEKPWSERSWKDVIPVGKCVMNILGQEFPIVGVVNNISKLCLGDFEWRELPGYVADTCLKAATLLMPQFKGVIFGLKCAKLLCNGISTAIKASNIISKISNSRVGLAVKNSTVGRAISSTVSTVKNAVSSAARSFWKKIKIW